MNPDIFTPSPVHEGGVLEEPLAASPDWLVDGAQAAVHSRKSQDVDDG